MPLHRSPASIIYARSVCLTHALRLRPRGNSLTDSSSVGSESRRSSSDGRFEYNREVCVFLLKTNAPRDRSFYGAFLGQRSPPKGRRCMVDPQPSVGCGFDPSLPRLVPARASASDPTQPVMFPGPRPTLGAPPTLALPRPSRRCLFGQLNESDSDASEGAAPFYD